MASTRDVMLSVLRRKRHDVVPVDIQFNDMTGKKYETQLQGKCEREFFGCGARDVSFNRTAAAIKNDYSEYYREGIPADYNFDEWGIARGRSQYGSRLIPPMESFATIEEIEAYPFPDYRKQECSSGLSDLVSKLQSEGCVTLGKIPFAVYSMGRSLRGYEKHLMDYFLEPDFTHKLLDHIVECQLQMVRAFVESGVDILWIISDIASQSNILLPPSVYKEFIKPRMKALVVEAKKYNPDILCAYHCCGNIMPIIDDLADIGMDILNPLQPESLDFTLLKKEYGERFVFWGGLSVQSVLPKGTEQEVREETRRLIDLLGQDGGYIISPANQITQDIPWNNLVSFIDGAFSYGGFRNAVT